MSSQIRLILDLQILVQITVRTEIPFGWRTDLPWTLQIGGHLDFHTSISYISHMAHLEVLRLCSSDGVEG